MKLLIVCDTGSIHAARWINQLEDTGWEVHVYHAAATGWSVSDELESATLHLPFGWTTTLEGIAVRTTVPTSPILRRARAHIPALEHIMRQRHERYLADLIEQLRPDIIHSLALNVNWMNLCAPVLLARQRLGSRFTAPWIYSSWGSDLDFYARMSDQRYSEVKDVIEHCDYYIAECERDARLAREMGLRGEFIGFIPAFGGVDSAQLDSLRQPGPASARRTIFIKGRDHANAGDPVGRAMTAMRAIAECQDALGGYRVIIGQADDVVASEAARLAATTNLDVCVLPRLPYDALLRTVGASRILIAMTVNDGLPSTLVEAMALGALPIHSNLEPIAEWIEDGVNGLLVPAEDTSALAEAIRRAVSDNALVDTAAAINAQTVHAQLSDEVVRAKVLDMYRHVSSNGAVIDRG